MIVNANNLALNGNKTNEEGKFEIVNSKGGSKVVFSNMGYQTQEKEIGTQTFFTIYLSEDSSSMEIVKVVSTVQKKADLGFLSIDKRELSSAVASVDLENTEKMPVVNVEQLLQGMAPGLQVVSASGDRVPLPVYASGAFQVSRV
ncbi:carboxypeptidase-like regulatory domain-containing protein [Niabella sp. W65]|nr:carboxypeptidase-like regulatory domain-containing protein [Niabella sp. W65]MCH7365400.1 carboxypeptidase-like regulatory domain-containing protein [Niabella sp. W65]ULT41189.1 carboxypeptidase-like regulatory domain-containing protein [Niabella sp. I65]